MPLLNTATKIYKGSSLATKVYRGTVQVWPPAAAYGPNQSAYTSQSLTETVTLKDFAFGNDFRFAVAGRIVGMRLNEGTSTAFPFPVTVWSNSTTILGTVVVNVTAGAAGWETAMFTTPLPITAGQTVRCAMNAPNSLTDQVGRRANFATDLVNGDITMLKQGYVLSMGGGTAPVYPTTTTANTYMVDVIFQKAL